MFAEHVSHDLLLNLFGLRESAVRFLEGRGVVHDDAEDIFQDALVAFQEGLDRFDPHYGSNRREPNGEASGCGFVGEDAPTGAYDPARVSPDLARRARLWFWGILRNKTKAHFRRSVRWSREVPERAVDAPDHFVVRIPEIIERLPSPEAEILVMRFMEGADLAFVARHCGVSVPTAHRRVRRALDLARSNI